MNEPSYAYVKIESTPGLKIWHDDTGKRHEEVKTHIAHIPMLYGEDQLENIMRLHEKGAKILGFGNFPKVGDTAAFYARVVQKLSRYIEEDAPDERVRSEKKRTGGLSSSNSQASNS